MRSANFASRKLPNSVNTSPEAVARRVSRFLETGTVETINGKSIRVETLSTLVHSDTPGRCSWPPKYAASWTRGGEVVPAIARKMFWMGNHLQRVQEIVGCAYILSIASRANPR